MSCFAKSLDGNESNIDYGFYLCVVCKINQEKGLTLFYIFSKILIKCWVTLDTILTDISYWRVKNKVFFNANIIKVLRE